jgi:hypothetical protein
MATWMTESPRIAVAALVVGAMSCTRVHAPADVDASPAALSATEQLIRLSVDLRGIRPSADELGRVDDDANSISSIVDDYLHDDRFAGRIKDVFAPAFRTRILSSRNRCRG